MPGKDETRRRGMAIIFFVSLLLVYTASWAATVTPSARVQESVPVHAIAAGDSEVVGRLAVGEEATFLAEVPRWFKVRLEDGTEGFVSKSWTRVVGEVAPSSTTAAPTTPATEGVPGWDLYGGQPKATRPDSEFEVLVKEDFTVGYSEAREDPLWVAYHLFKVENPTTHTRPRRFQTDTATQAQVTHDCYTNSGFDRGHNAPNYAIDTRYGRPAQLQTFFMSNVCPQAPHLNRETWEAFEKVEANDYANRFGNIWTITGPIFDASPATITCGVQVPKGFYKIVTELENGMPAMLAVVMPQDVHGQRTLRDLVTTVDHVEEVTGLDFFPDLPAEVQKTAESAQPDANLWGLDRTLVPTIHGHGDN